MVLVEAASEWLLLLGEHPLPQPHTGPTVLAALQSHLSLSSPGLSLPVVLQPLFPAHLVSVYPCLFFIPSRSTFTGKSSSITRF